MTISTTKNTWESICDLFSSIEIKESSIEIGVVYHKALFFNPFGNCSTILASCVVVIKNREGREFSSIFYGGTLDRSASLYTIGHQEVRYHKYYRNKLNFRFRLFMIVTSPKQIGFITFVDFGQILDFRIFADLDCTGKWYFQHS
jgi:hypothetical protein